MSLPGRTRKDTLNPYKAHWEQALILFLQSARSLHNYPRSLLYLGPRLYDFLVSETELSCWVDGSTDEYETVITVSRNKLRTRCTCPVELHCKHGLALALALAHEARRRGYIFPSSVMHKYGQAFDRLGSGVIEIPEVDVILGELETPASTIPERWWEVVISNAPWSLQEPVLRKVIKQRLQGSSFWDVNNVLAVVKTFRNPIHRLRAIEGAVEKQRRQYTFRKGAAVGSEPELLTFLASTEATELEEKFDREVAEADLVLWLQEMHAEAESSRRRDRMEVYFVPVLVQDGFYTLMFQLHAEAGQRGLVARRPNGISTIVRDVDAGSRDFGPLRNKLVHWINDTQTGYRLFGENVTTDDTLISVRNVYQWVTLWGKCLRWSDGTRIAFAPWVAELTLSTETEGDPSWVVRLPAHDGQQASEIPFADATVFIDIPEEADDSPGTGYSYFIRIDDSIARVETHGMSPIVLRAIRKLGTLPMDALVGTTAGSALLQILSEGHHPAGVSRWVKEVPCRGEVEIAVREDSDFVVSAKAVSTDGSGVEFCWRPELGWRQLDAEGEDAERGEQLEEDGGGSAESVAQEGEAGDTGGNDDVADDGVADEVSPDMGRYLHAKPRGADVETLENWLDMMVSRIGGLMVAPDACSFSGRITAADLLPIWFQRPAGVNYYGNPDFRRMITVRAAPRISVTSESTGMDWLKVSVALENEISQTSMVEMSRLLAASAANFVRLPDGSIYRRADLEAYRDQVDSLNALGLTTGTGEQKLHALHLAGAPAGALLRLESGGGALASLVAKSRQILKDFSGVPEAPVPESTSAFLRPYQRAGVDFLCWAAANFGGALLADDMGLGKTLQMLATVSALRHGLKSGSPGPSLVICPASVAHNWEREAHRFAPELRVLVLESGAGRRKHLDQLEKYDLVIMNFALLRRDVEPLKKINWFVIVADEAQAIKNPGSESSRAIKQLQSRYRFALTGTPIENRIADLYSIVDFALPGYLGDMDKATNSTDPEAAARASRLLRSRLRPVLMRRLKVEVAPELPERVETRIDCDMGGAQKKLYAAEVKRVRMMLEGLGEAGIKGKHRIQILAALMRLRQICCDPMLLGHPEIPSGKTDELLELVPPLLEAGHKVLIFSQFVKMLNHLEEQLAEQKIRTYKLTGATTNRQALVDEFEKDPEPAAFLISLKAGGTGLNLVSASHVILFDPWWNPSVEAQAIDRTHRIGQDKTVVAYRLVTVGTIEERILELQEKKRALVRNILEEDSFNRTLTGEDFEFLLGD